jgi:hypothetical protein
MAVITTGSHPKALWPGVYAWFGAKYNEHPAYYEKLFDVKTSRKNFEEMVQQTGFGLAPVKAEGASTAYQGHVQGYVARGTHVAYSLGYIVTREELADNLYEEVSMRRAGSLAFSMASTRNHIGANVYNRAFTSTYTGGDAKELCATDHPSVSGNQSNELATPADFSEAALEDLTIQIMNATDPQGLRISLTPKSLIGPNELVYEFERVLKSSLRVDSANNDINALKSMGVIPEAVNNPYLTDTDAWFIRTNGVEAGICWFDREPVQFTKDVDFDTDNAKAKAYMRLVAFWGDWRAVYGSPGA